MGSGAYRGATVGPGVGVLLLGHSSRGRGRVAGRRTEKTAQISRITKKRDRTELSRSPGRGWRRRAGHTGRDARSPGPAALAHPFRDPGALSSLARRARAQRTLASCRPPALSRSPLLPTEEASSPCGPLAADRPTSPGAAADDWACRDCASAEALSNLPLAPHWLKALRARFALATSPVA